MSDSLDRVLAEQADDERRTAVRALLRRPLLHEGTDPAGLTQVRRHEGWLRRELWSLAGYDLTVHAGGWARLRKRAIDPTDIRPLRFPPVSRWQRRSTALDKRPRFSRRQYVLLALCCAVLCRGHAYISLRRLVEETAALAADSELTTQLWGTDRRGFVGVLLWLEEQGALERRDGTEQALDSWRKGDPESDLLWRVNGGLAADLLGAARPITRETSPASLFDDGREYASADDRRNLRGKWRVARRLFEQSAVYVEDLDEDERAWWRTKRAWTEDQVARLTGLHVERRREGTMLVDQRAESGRALSDLRFPDNRPSRASQMALLLCAWFAERLRDGDQSTVLEADVLARAEQLAAEYGSSWRIATGDREQALDVAREALALLEGHRLVVERGPQLEIRPGACRYRHPRVERNGERAA